MQGKNEKYPEVNLLNTTLVNLNINFMIFIDKKGNLFHYKGVDLETTEDIILPKEFIEIIQTQNQISTHTTPLSSATGFIKAREQTLMFASRPIMNNDFVLPIAGTLIVARYLNSSEIDSIARSTLQRLEIKNYSERKKFRYYNEAVDNISDDNSIFVKVLNKESIAAYCLIKDIFGNPILILKVDKPRDIYMQGKKTINYFLLSLILIGISFCILVYVLLENYVISKLLTLSNSVHDIATEKDFSARVLLEGKDELSNLGGNINEMLSSLEEKQNIIKTSKDELEIRVQQRTSELQKLNIDLKMKLLTVSKKKMN